MGLAHGLLEDLHKPSSVIRLNSVFAAFSLSGDSRRGRSATGGPDVIMVVNGERRRCEILGYAKDFGELFQNVRKFRVRW